jgi:hypothetical protein
MIGGTATHPGGFEIQGAARSYTPLLSLTPRSADKLYDRRMQQAGLLWSVGKAAQERPALAPLTAGISGKPVSSGRMP